LPLVNFSPESAQLPLNSLPHQRCRVRLLAGILQRHLNVSVRHAPRPQIPRDAVLTLFARYRAVPRELLGIPRVVQQVLPLQPVHHALHQLFVFAAPRQRLLHFVHRMRAPHQCLDRGIVKQRFRLQLPWFPKHTKSIEVSASRNKRCVPPSTPRQIIHSPKPVISTGGTAFFAVPERRNPSSSSAFRWIPAKRTRVCTTPALCARSHTLIWSAITLF